MVQKGSDRFPSAPEGTAILAFEFNHEEFVPVLSVSSLLYDLVLAHDLSVLLAYPQYRDYEFTGHFWRRNGRPIERHHRLRTLTIATQSPLSLVAVVAAVGGLWTLIQLLEKVRNWRLETTKLRLEIEKLKREHVLMDIELLERLTQDDIRSACVRASDIQEGLVRRLGGTGFKLTSLRIQEARSQDARSGRSGDPLRHEPRGGIPE